MSYPFARPLRVLARALIVVTFAAPSPAAAQDALSARLLTFEDARELSTAAQAAFTEGMKSTDPRVRARAVRAAGRFETPALLTQILPLLSDPNADVRHWAAIAAASSARIFPGQSIEALLTALDTTAPADWGVFAAQLGRISMPVPEVFARVEKALASGLPAITPVPGARVGARLARAADAPKIEGAGRGLEALTRVSGKVAPLSADTRARLSAVVESPDAPGTRSRARTRRLALSALRNARAVDGALARVAATDADDEVRRLAVLTAAAAVVADAAVISDADRETVLTAGLKDVEPRVRLEAVRGWGRHLQARSCQPVLAAVADRSAHVALQALDLLGAGCAAAPAPVSALLQKEAEALPASGATWHRAAHALVSLAGASPADVRTLLPRFVGHPTWQVRMYAARAAGQTGTIEPLVRLGSDAHDNVREAALEELARLKRPEALPVAYDALMRPDYHLVITAARALEAEADKAKATAALLAALARITREGRDTSRDPRVALMTRLIETGAVADAAATSPYLRDFDPKVAELAAKAISQWTGTVREADPLLRPTVPPDAAALEPLRRQHLRITMARGGVIELRLLVDEASATVLRVAELTKRGHYTGLTFHRVEPTFVLQGGSPGANEYMGDGPYMRDEPGVAHNRGTVGISTRGRDTGDGQLFINLVDSPRLDHAYTVFAVVERGMDVADTVLEGDVMARVELVAAPPQ